jgi:hypothetical protein
MELESNSNTISRLLREIDRSASAPAASGFGASGAVGCRLDAEDRLHRLGRRLFRQRFSRHVLEIERGDRLRLVVLDEREVVLRQPAHDVAVPVANDDVARSAQPRAERRTPLHALPRDRRNGDRNEKDERLRQKRRVIG